MSKHSQLTDELQERACLYAAGALPESERIDYVRHLEEDDCAVCRDEARQLVAAAHALALSAPLETPSPQVKERLMVQVRASLPPIHRPVAATATRPWLAWV